MKAFVHVEHYPQFRKLSGTMMNHIAYDSSGHWMSHMISKFYLMAESEQEQEIFTGIDKSQTLRVGVCGKEELEKV